MKRSRSKAWEEFEQDAQASGGGNTLRGIARIALTCFVEPMQKLQQAIDKLIELGIIRKVHCKEVGCNAYGIKHKDWLLFDHCEYMMMCWTCSQHFCSNHGKYIENGDYCICDTCAILEIK